jgi:hypothetical protein
MRSDELAHIRADVHQAILEAQQHDPTVTLEILWRLFDQVGALAVGDVEALSDSWRAALWAEELLRDVQLRAVSKVPYGEPVDDEPPREEDHR